MQATYNPSALASINPGQALDINATPNICHMLPVRTVGIEVLQSDGSHAGLF